MWRLGNMSAMTDDPNPLPQPTSPPAPGGPTAPPPLPPRGGLAPPPQVAIPYATPYFAPPPTRPEDPRAAKLVMWSHVLGWGGLALLVVGAFVAGLAHRNDRDQAVFGMVMLGVGLVSAIVGAIIGQIGRGMQGRVI